MLITRQTAAAKIAAYLHHEISAAQIVEWAEHALLEGEFAGPDMAALRVVIPRLAVADIRAFGLTWEDCAQLLEKLGYHARVEVSA